MGARRMANRRFVKPIATPHVTSADRVRLQPKEIGRAVRDYPGNPLLHGAGDCDRCLVATSHPGPAEPEGVT
jgi:hypothetical protein